MQENAAKKNGLNSTKGLLALAVTLNPMELSVTSMKREREKERGKGGGSRQKRGREFNNLAVRISLLALKSPMATHRDFSSPLVFSTVCRSRGKRHARRERCTCYFAPCITRERSRLPISRRDLKNGARHDFRNGRCHRLRNAHVFATFFFLPFLSFSFFPPFFF